jgi:hypothetical protein
MGKGRVLPAMLEKQPGEGRHEKSDPETALHQRDAAATRPNGPQFGDDRRSGHPFGPDRDPDQESQHRERRPVPRQGAQPRHKRIGEDRQHHGALAAEIIGEHAADQAADRPAEQRERDDGSGVDGNLTVLGRLEKLAQRGADRDHQREGLVAIEHPTEIGGDQRVPLAAVEQAIPGHRVVRRCPRLFTQWNELPFIRL